MPDVGILPSGSCYPNGPGTSSSRGALAIFAPLYALIYLLLRLEQYPLLIGAISSFLGVAAVMYFTRRIGWYNSLSEIPSSQ